YKLARLSAAGKNYMEQKSSLLKLLEITPSNIVPRLQLSELLAQEGKSDSALFFMQSIKKIVPEFNAATDSIYRRATAFIANGRQAANAVQYIQEFQKLMQLTEAYASGLDDIDQPKLL